jgi:hypothetical protein
MGESNPKQLEGLNRPQTSDSVLVALATMDQRLSSIEERIAETHHLLQQRAVEKEWYSTAELAEEMRVSHYTVQERWCNAGRIECVKDHETGRWRIPGHEYRRLVTGGGLRPRS